MVVHLLVAIGIIYIIYLAKKKLPKKKRQNLLQNIVFIFNAINVVIFGVGFVLLLPISFMVSAGSPLRMKILMIEMVIGIISITSLFKPKFTALTFVFYGVLGYHLYLEHPDTIKNTSYVDVCNEIRKDVKCVEEKDRFVCSSKIVSKKICINNTGGNDEETYKSIESEYINKIFVTEDLYFYEKNLPRNNCRNRACGHKYEVALRDKDAGCTNCLGADRVTTLLRMEPVYIGTPLKVVEAFELKSQNSLGRSFTIYVFEDPEGIRSEMFDYEFKHQFIERRPIPIEEIKKRDKIIESISRIKENGSLSQTICLNPTKVDEKTSIYPEHSRYIEVRLLHFINSFKLEKDMNVLETFWRKSERPISNKPPIYLVGTCARVIFKSVSAYILYKYHGGDWGMSINAQLLNDDEVTLDCLPKGYFGESRLCEKLEGQLSFNLSWNELIKTKFKNYLRGNEREFLLALEE